MAAITVTAAQVGPCFSDRGKSEVYTGVAAETITKGDALYIDTNGLLGPCDTNDAGCQQFRGIALTAGGAGAAIDYITHGCVYGFTLDGDADAFVYASDTPGILDTAAGTMTVRAGRIVRLTDNDATKVLMVHVRWCSDWS